MTHLSIGIASVKPGCLFTLHYATNS